MSVAGVPLVRAAGHGDNHLRVHCLHPPYTLHSQPHTLKVDQALTQSNQG